MPGGLLEIAVKDQVKPTVEHEGGLQFCVIKPGS